MQYSVLLNTRTVKEVPFMLRKDRYDMKVRLHPRRSDLTPHTLEQSHSPVLQQPESGMSLQRSLGDSLTKQLLLRQNRENLVRSYKEIMWQQRTMDDSITFEFDPFHFMDEEL